MRPETSNEQFIREISACNGDPSCIAIRQAEHFARITARLQLDAVALQEISREQVELRQHFDTFVDLTEQNRETIRNHLARIDERLSELVP